MTDRLCSRCHKPGDFRYPLATVIIPQGEPTPCAVCIGELWNAQRMTPYLPDPQRLAQLKAQREQLQKGLKID